MARPTVRRSCPRDDGRRYPRIARARGSGRGGARGDAAGRKNTSSRPGAGAHSPATIVTGTPVGDPLVYRPSTVDDTYTTAGGRGYSHTVRSCCMRLLE